MSRFVYRGRVETLATTEYQEPSGKTGSREDVRGSVDFEVTAKDHKEMEEVVLSAMPPLKDPEDLHILEPGNPHLRRMKSAIIYYTYRVIVVEIEGE